MGTLKRIASTGCDWKESFDKEEHDQLYKVVNDPESESRELVVYTGDFKVLARGPISFFDNLPEDMGDWLYDYDHENIYWDEEVKEIRVFWKGNFITREAWDAIIQVYYEDDDAGEDDFLKDVEKNLIPTEKDFANYKTKKWMIYIPEEGHWLIDIKSTAPKKQAREVYLKWAKRKILPKGSFIQLI